MHQEGPFLFTNDYRYKSIDIKRIHAGITRITYESSYYLG